MIRTPTTVLWALALQHVEEEAKRCGDFVRLNLRVCVIRFGGNFRNVKGCLRLKTNVGIGRAVAPSLIGAMAEGEPRRSAP